MMTLRTYKPFLTVVAALVFVWVVLEVVAFTAVGWASPTLWPREPLPDPFSLNQAASRVVGGQLQHRLAADKHRLGLIVGLSSLREGVDAQILQEYDGMDARWIVIGTSGGGMLHLEHLVTRLRALKVDPDVLVMGLHYGFFARTDPEPPRWIDHVDETRKSFAAGRLGNTLLGMMRTTWWGKNYPRVHWKIQFALDEARDRLQGALGQPPEVIYAASPTPWTGDYQYPDEIAPESVRQAQLDGVRGVGWFDSNNYTSANPNVALFKKLATALGRETPLLILMMPEDAALRALTPEAPAKATVEAAIESLRSAGRTVEFLDLRGLIPDEMFHDHTHLRPAGREKLSRRLAQELTEFGK